MGICITMMTRTRTRSAGLTRLKAFLTMDTLGHTWTATSSAAPSSACSQDCVGAWDEYAECYHDTEEHKNKRCRLYKVAIAAKNTVTPAHTPTSLPVHHRGVCSACGLCWSWETTAPATTMRLTTRTSAAVFTKSASLPEQRLRFHTRTSSAVHQERLRTACRLREKVDQLWKLQPCCC